MPEAWLRASGRAAENKESGAHDADHLYRHDDGRDCDRKAKSNRKYHCDKRYCFVFRRDCAIRLPVGDNWSEQRMSFKPHLNSRRAAPKGEGCEYHKRGGWQNWQDRPCKTQYQRDATDDLPCNAGCDVAGRDRSLRGGGCGTNHGKAAFGL